jgi:hypothetical protein
MALFRMFDASVPPDKPYPACQAAGGYIGGATPHVWTLQEWLRFSHLRQLPIWTADFNPGAPSAAEQGRLAAAAAVALGWHAHAPHRRAIALDMETSEDAAFVADFAVAARAGGFVVWPYGSKSTIYADPHADGYWVAAWDDIAGLENMADIMAHQYEADIPFGGTQIDLSVMSGEAYARLGRGPRH